MLDLADVKARVGLEADDDSYDDALTKAIPLVTMWFEQYCGRGLALRTDFVEEIGNPDGWGRIYLYNRPLVSVAQVLADGYELDLSSIRLMKALGYIETKEVGSTALSQAEVLTVKYTGGYDTDEVPEDLAQAFAECSALRCNITLPTVGSAGSSAIRAIGLGGGALSVQFDTAAGGLSGSYNIGGVPPEVQQYASVLNYYRWVPL
jgi:hypothetical protein